MGDGSVLRMKVQRRFSDLDPLGHVNNVVFYDYLQEARVGLLERLGQMDVATINFVVVRQELNFRKPLLYHPEPITIETWVGRVSNSSYTIEYRILDEIGDVVADGTTLLAAIDLETGRPIRIAPELRPLLLALIPS